MPVGQRVRRRSAEAEHEARRGAAGDRARVRGRGRTGRGRRCRGGRRDRTPSPRGGAYRGSRWRLGPTAARAYGGAATVCGRRRHGHRPRRREDGGGRQDRDGSGHPEPPHQSICRRMKVGISMSGTSVDPALRSLAHPRGRRCTGCGGWARRHGGGHAAAPTLRPRPLREIEHAGRARRRVSGCSPVTARSKPVAMTVTRTSPCMRRVVAGAEDDLGVVAHGVVDDVVDLGGLAQGQVVAADDVDQHARWRRRSRRCRAAGSRWPAGPPRARGSRPGRCRCPSAPRRRSA